MRRRRRAPRGVRESGLLLPRCCRVSNRRGVQHGVLRQRRLPLHRNVQRRVHGRAGVLLPVRVNISVRPSVPCWVHLRWGVGAAGRMRGGAGARVPRQQHCAMPLGLYLRGWRHGPRAMQRRGVRVPRRFYRRGDLRCWDVWHRRVRGDVHDRHVLRRLHVPRGLLLCRRVSLAVRVALRRWVHVRGRRSAPDGVRGERRRVVPRWERRADVVRRRRLRDRGRRRELRERGLRRALHVRPGVLLSRRCCHAHVVCSLPRWKRVRWRRRRRDCVHDCRNVLLSGCRSGRRVQRGVLWRNWWTGRFYVRWGLHLRPGLVLRRRIHDSGW